MNQKRSATPVLRTRKESSTLACACAARPCRITDQLANTPNRRGLQRSPSRCSLALARNPSPYRRRHLRGRRDDAQCRPTPLNGRVSCLRVLPFLLTLVSAASRHERHHPVCRGFHLIPMKVEDRIPRRGVRMHRGHSPLGGPAAARFLAARIAAGSRARGCRA